MHENFLVARLFDRHRGIVVQGRIDRPLASPAQELSEVQLAKLDHEPFLAR